VRCSNRSGKRESGEKEGYPTIEEIVFQDIPTTFQHPNDKKGDPELELQSIASVNVADIRSITVRKHDKILPIV